jgi:hypothetical protein
LTEQRICLYQTTVSYITNGSLHIIIDLNAVFWIADELPLSCRSVETARTEAEEGGETVVV